MKSSLALQMQKRLATETEFSAKSVVRSLYYYFVISGIAAKVKVHSEVLKRTWPSSSSSIQAGFNQSKCSSQRNPSKNAN